MKNKYVSLSRNDLYSIIIILPLFMLYEFLGYVNNFQSTFIIRNGADVYLRQFFSYFGEYDKITYTFFLFFALLIILLKNSKLISSSHISIWFLFLMIGESFMHSLSMLCVMSLFSNFFLSINFIENSILEQIYLSIGAGLWEELLFRYLLISVLLYFFNKFYRIINLQHYFIIILISSSIFSYFHFLGPFGDSINLSIFLYRMIAGIILSCIFIFRGLGITIYTHVFYDIYLVTF